MYRIAFAQLHDPKILTQLRFKFALAPNADRSIKRLGYSTLKFFRLSSIQWYVFSFNFPQLDPNALKGQN
jgi:hypothetical protein